MTSPPRSPSLRFTASGRLGRTLVIALGGNVAMAWIVLLGLSTFFERVWRGLGSRFAGQSLSVHWEQIEAARHLQGLAWIATAVLFLFWLRRAYGNATAIGAVRIRLSPRWVVGAFLIPGVNLLWPFLIVREIWNASGPGSDASRPPQATPVWLASWWVLFVVATVLDPGFARLVEDTSMRFSLGWPTLLLVVAQLAEMAAGALGIVVVQRIDRRQDARWQSVEAAEIC